MKKRKWIMPVVLLCLLALLLFLYLVLKNKNQQEEAETASAPMLEMESDSVTELSFQVDGEQADFVKEEETWVNTGDENFPVNQDKINDLVEDLTTAEADRVLTDVEELSQYGLEEPVNTVKFKDSSGTEKEMLLGSQNQGTGSYYLCFADDLSTVYVTSTDVAGNLPPDIMEMAEYTSYPEITSTYVQEIRVDKSEGSYYLLKNEETTDWEVTGEDGRSYSAEYQEASGLALDLADLTYSGLADYAAEDLSVYGLENPSAKIFMKYEVEKEEEETDESAESSSQEEEEEPEMEERELTLFIGNQDEEGDYYVRLEGSSQVNTVSSDTISEILNSNSISYWDSSLGYFSVDTLKNVQVTYQENVKTIERQAEEIENEEGETEEEVTYISGSTVLDESKTETFLYGMASISAQSKDPQLSASHEPEFSVTVTTEEETFTVTYTSYDENFHLAVDSEGRPGLVNKNDVKEMIEEYQAIWS